jgi:hypothetical protein
MLKKIILLIMISAIAYAADNSAKGLSKLTEDQLTAKQKMDMESLVIYRSGLQSISAYIKSGTDLFSPEKNSGGMIAAPAREEMKSLWKSICDYYLAIDSIDLYHRDYPALPDKSQRNSFNICRAAMLMEYRFAMDFIERAEKIKGLNAVLNDSIPEIGLPSGTYNSFKFRFLNVKIASEFAAFEAVSIKYGKPDNNPLAKGIKDDSSRIWKLGAWKGEALTLKNGADILKNAGKKTWFPVQKGISNFAGDAKVYRIHSSLITDKQISELTGELKPGDIILERREWYLTNIGIPGFWTHAAVYIGTPEERKVFFNNSGINLFLKENGAGSIEDLLKKSTSKYSQCVTPDSSGHAPRVIEAIGEGVLFTTIEHSASCDSIAVLRPRLSKKEIAHALIRAFRYSGRPYDFDFDFLTDSSLVCTELVYKSYEPGVNIKGITFPLEKIMGRNILPANGIAGMYTSELKKSQRQMDFVLFYDGIEMKKKAVRSTEKNFSKSFERPKWHVFAGQ